MERVIEFIKKHKWWFIVYCIYIPLAVFVIHDEVSKRDFIPTLLVWVVTVPIIVMTIVYFVYKKFFSTEEYDDAVRAIEENPIEETIDISEDNKLFVEVWKLMDFAEVFGHTMKRVKCTNSITGKEFYKCVFIDDSGNRTWVNIMSYMGKITPQEISERKGKLMIGKRDDGNYYLYDGDIKKWEEVRL